MPQWTPERRTIVILDKLADAISHTEQLLREAPWAQHVLERLLKYTEIAQQIAGRDLTREMSLPSVHLGAVLSRNKMGPFKIPDPLYSTRRGVGMEVRARDEEDDGVWTVDMSGAFHVGSVQDITEVRRGMNSFLDSLESKMRSDGGARVASRFLEARRPDPEKMDEDEACYMADDIKESTGEKIKEAIQSAQGDQYEARQFILRAERAWREWDWDDLEDLNLISHDDREFIRGVMGLTDCGW